MQIRPTHLSAYFIGQKLSSSTRARAVHNGHEWNPLYVCKKLGKEVVLLVFYFCPKVLCVCVLMC